MKISLYLFLLILICTFRSCSDRTSVLPSAKYSSDKISVKLLLEDPAILALLNYPILVKSLYKSNNQNFIWFNSRTVDKQLPDAMMLLDCVAQYGLNPAGYHPKWLTYSNVSVIRAENEERHALKDSVDIFMTDAILTLIADLHFGRANPHISKDELDNLSFAGFKIDSVFLKALRADLTSTIRDAEPVDAGYSSLQDYLRLAIGQYAGDCYEIPEDTLKLIALNMERYRWENALKPVTVRVNIPSFTIKFFDGQGTLENKVIVGKPGSPTATHAGIITSMRTPAGSFVSAKHLKSYNLKTSLLDSGYHKSGSLKIYDQNRELITSSISTFRKIQEHPAEYFLSISGRCDDSLARIIFDFDSLFQDNLHDAPNQKLFLNDYRALSGGCIWIEKPRELAINLLKVSGASRDEYHKLNTAMNTRAEYFYSFKYPVNAAISYITCVIRDGELIFYPDIYGRDKALKDKLFGSAYFVPGPP